jgi:hypothetical protein
VSCPAWDSLCTVWPETAPLRINDKATILSDQEAQQHRKRLFLGICGNLAASQDHSALRGYAAARG